MRRDVNLSAGTIKQYNRNTQVDWLKKVGVIAILSCFVLFIVYELIPNPYLCYGYKPIKISKYPIEFDWTGKAYRCRFDIANSGVLALHNPILQLYFIDGANVILDEQSSEWQKNDDVNYFWTKNISISGGINRIDFAERAQAIDVIFHKKGINRIGYIISSNGLQKRGVIRVISKH